MLRIKNILLFVSVDANIVSAIVIFKILIYRTHHCFVDTANKVATHVESGQHLPFGNDRRHGTIRINTLRLPLSKLRRFGD